MKQPVGVFVAGCILLATAIIAYAQSPYNQGPRNQIVNMNMVMQGPTPTASSCGTSPSIIGNNNAMMVTAGSTGIFSTCTVTFAAGGFASPPSCIAQSGTDIIALRIATTATTVSVTSLLAIGNASKINIQCFGMA